MNKINTITNIITVCSLLLCTAGRAQDLSDNAELLASADSCEKIDLGFYSLPLISAFIRFQKQQLPVR